MNVEKLICECGCVDFGIYGCELICNDCIAKYMYDNDKDLLMKKFNLVEKKYSLNWGKVNYQTKCLELSVIKTDVNYRNEQLYKINGQWWNKDEIDRMAKEWKSLITGENSCDTPSTSTTKEEG